MWEARGARSLLSGELAQAPLASRVSQHRAPYDISNYDGNANENVTQKTHVKTIGLLIKPYCFVAYSLP